ncbi:hypothetical protein HanPSC8_Chr16g0711661 [Helianthus annuus]|nr:hypothetical protein HanPSC8_Chr16g0711661 [Helianthus annuus]
MVMMINLECMHHKHPYSKARFKIHSLSSLVHSRPNTPSHFNIPFSKSNHEDSRANHGDSKLVKRFGSDFKQVSSKNKPHITIFCQKPI